MSFIRASLLAVMAIFAVSMSQPAAAQSPSDNVIVVTPSNMQSVLDPGASSPYTYIFVEVCPASRQDCVDEVQKFALSTALARGGWLGPNVTQGTGFFAMDPSPVNLAALSAICAKGNIPGQGVCDASKGQFPLFIMFRTDGSKSQTLVGPVDDNNFGYLLNKFTR
jgi:hypothetical protein